MKEERTFFLIEKWKYILFISILPPSPHPGGYKVTPPLPSVNGVIPALPGMVLAVLPAK